MQRAATPFDLFDNPFVLLGLTPRDPADVILEATQNQIARKPDQESDFLEARRKIMASRARLRAELRTLADVAPARAKILLQSLRQGLLPPDLSALGFLTRANAAAHLCTDAEAVGGASALSVLKAAQEAITPSFLCDIVNQNRSLAGFPQVTEALVAEELRLLRQDYVQAAFERLRRLSDPAESFAGLVTAEGEASSAAAATMAREATHETAQRAARELALAENRQWFLDRLGERYRAHYAQELAAQERGIRRKLDGVLRGDGVSLDELGQDLAHLSKRLRPLQKLDALKSLDEPFSRRIAEDLRRAAREQAAMQPAMTETIYTLLLAQFAGLPDFSVALSQDLRGLDADKLAREQQAAVERFQMLLQAADRDPAALVRALKNGHFRENSPTLAGQLATALMEADRSFRDRAALTAEARMDGDTGLAMQGGASTASSGAAYGSGGSDPVPGLAQERGQDRERAVKENLDRLYDLLRDLAYSLADKHGDAGAARLLLRAALELPRQPPLLKEIEVRLRGDLAHFSTGSAFSNKIPVVEQTLRNPDVVRERAPPDPSMDWSSLLEAKWLPVVAALLGLGLGFLLVSLF